MNNTNQKYFVYAISSLTRNYIYVGMTNNLNRRIGDHNKGYNRITKPYLPFKIIYTEEYWSRSETIVSKKSKNLGSGESS